MANSKLGILVNLFLPQRRKPNPEYAIPEKDKNLEGKTIVFTGGTDGMGRVAVEMLYEMGAHVVVLGRNKTKIENVINEIIKTGGSGKLGFQICDLASMDSVKNCAERILAEYSKIDVLINNAGINMTKPTFTSDGFETNWAVNYLGGFLLTKLLLTRIQQSSPSRIVNLTTNTNFIKQIDFDDIESKLNFDTVDSYTQAKLSMNMFSIDLAKKLEGKGVTVNYLYPGYIRSNLLSNLEGPEKMMQFFMNVMASPTEVGADRIIRLAISSEYEGKTGVYVSEDKIKPPHKEAQIESKRNHLKKISEKALKKWL
ncbi:SDR family NAD(P)-dependent oxidoreductase [Maribacter luteus]|uniref:SDR family NAD(P)-dependent oxidoreductase n=1 Tax=Maribacter luteus TaxID=2594478 RepID=A0A6I2MQK8_9FLAO|nr:SDR family NAD(P)-dependent oxidoreductase [Maribacter luteus]MRX64730.1 SDR family NAD(P)-dependent oxidoreductase [Maribacter luteus]